MGGSETNMQGTSVLFGQVLTVFGTVVAGT
jgi:hypothetical protein